MIGSKTLIAVAVAGLLAAPLALAQSTSSTGPGAGPANMDKRSADEQTPPKSDQEKSATGKARNRADASASDSNHDKRAAKSAKKKSKDRVASNTNPDTSTRGGSAMGSTRARDPDANTSNVTGDGVANTPGAPGTSSPSAGK
jgi:hypothetical protein